LEENTSKLPDKTAENNQQQQQHQPQLPQQLQQQPQSQQQHSKKEEAKEEEVEETNEESSPKTSKATAELDKADKGSDSEPEDQDKETGETKDKDDKNKERRRSSPSSKEGGGARERNRRRHKTSRRNRGEKKTRREGSDSSRSALNSESYRSNTPRPFDGFIFACDSHTYSECMSLNIFGGPRKLLSLVSEITPYDTPLFLFHTSERVLYGVFEPTSRGAENIHPWAWARGEYNSPFPAQVQFRYKYEFYPLPESKFKHLIKYQPNDKPSPTLSKARCRQLIEAFAEHDAATARRAADQLVQFFNL